MVRFWKNLGCFLIVVFLLSSCDFIWSLNKISPINKTYTHKLFSISYPEGWVAGNRDGSYNALNDQALLHRPSSETNFVFSNPRVTRQQITVGFTPKNATHAKFSAEQVLGIIADEAVSSYKHQLKNEMGMRSFNVKMEDYFYMYSPGRKVIISGSNNKKSVDIVLRLFMDDKFIWFITYPIWEKYEQETIDRLEDLVRSFELRY